VFIQKVEPRRSQFMAAYEMQWPIIECVKMGSCGSHVGIVEFTGAMDHFCNSVLHGV
jgi:hypothetical protein